MGTIRFELRRDKLKLFKVVDSSKTIDQVCSAKNYLELFENKWHRLEKDLTDDQFMELDTFLKTMKLNLKYKINAKV